MPKESRQAIEELEAHLRNRFPDGRFVLDAPINPNGVWYLDVDVAGHSAIVQWRSDSGFGISSASEYAYGEKADEVYADEEAAYARLVSLLLSRTYTNRPERVRMRTLRKERGISQEVLANHLNIRQAAVSKLERRDDVLVSTLRDVIRSMGGELRLLARFSDGVERELEIGERPSAVAEDPPDA